MIAAVLLLSLSRESFADTAARAWPLKVGLIVPLTGPLAEYGVAFRNGVELAQRDAVEISDNCSFVLEDSKYDSKTAVGLLQKLSGVDQAPVIYNWGGPTSDAIAPLADRNDIALFVWSADPAVSEGRTRVIRFSNSGFDYGGAIARYLQARGYKKVGIVKTENQYIHAILNGVQSSGTPLEVEIVDNYQPGDQDFRSTVSKLKGRQFDALGVFLLSGQVSQFAKQLRAQANALPLFGTDFFESMTEVQQSDGGLVGAVFSNNEVSDRFRKSYVSRYGNDLQINHAANGYDFATFLCKKLGAKLKGLSPIEIVQAAGAAGSVEGEQGTGTFTLSDKGDKYFKFPIVIRKIEAQQIVSVGPG